MPMMTRFLSSKSTARFHQTNWSWGSNVHSWPQCNQASATTIAGLTVGYLYRQSFVWKHKNVYPSALPKKLNESGLLWTLRKTSCSIGPVEVKVLAGFSWVRQFLVHAGGCHRQGNYNWCWYSSREQMYTMIYHVYSVYCWDVQWLNWTGPYCIRRVSCRCCCDNSPVKHKKGSFGEGDIRCRSCTWTVQSKRYNKINKHSPMFALPWGECGESVTTSASQCAKTTFQRSWSGKLTQTVPERSSTVLNY